VDKGKAFKRDDACTVLSYNLLAPLYVRPIDTRTGNIQEFAAFKWVTDPAVLDWEMRRKKIRNELVRSEADIIFLQEIQFDVAPSEDKKVEKQWTLPAWLKLPGYEFCIPSQSSLGKIADRNLRVLRSHSPIGNAILLRKKRVKRVDGDAIMLQKMKIKSSTQRVIARIEGVGHLSNMPETLVSSVHLDATDERKRVSLLLKCLKNCERLQCPGGLIIGGDMNADLGLGTAVGGVLRDASRPTLEQFKLECARGLRIDETNDTDSAAATKSSEPKDILAGGKEEITRKLSEAMLKDWVTLWETARIEARHCAFELLQVPTGPTRAGFDHGKSVGPCVSWRLDHILYSGHALKLDGVWTALEADHTSATSGLPNETCPSDHLPIAASLVPRENVAEEKDTAFCRNMTITLQKIEQTERSETDDLQRALKRETPAAVVAFEQSELSTAANESAEKLHEGTNKEKSKRPKKKKRGKSRVKPPAEVVQFYRERRKRLGVLESTQRDRRSSTVDSLTDREYRFLGSLLSASSRMKGGESHRPVETWVRSGKRLG